MAIVACMVVGCAGAKPQPNTVQQGHDPLDTDSEKLQAGVAQVDAEAETGQIDPEIEALLDIIKHPWRPERHKAAKELETYGSKVVEPLIDLLEHRDQIVRGIAARLLGRIGDAKAIDPLARALPYTTDSEAAMTALVRFGDAAVDRLIVAMDDENYRARYQAVEALGRIKSQKAEGRLIEGLTDSSPAVRKRSVRALLKLKSETATPGIIALLGDPDRHVRAAAAEALKGLGSRAAVMPLIEALDDEDSLVRVRAIEALDKLGDPRAVGPLKSKLHDGHWDVRRLAVVALYPYVDKSWTEELLTLLRGEDDHVRICAIQLLKKIDDPRVLDEMIGALEDSNKTIRSEALRGLDRFRSPRAVKALVGLMKDESWRNRLKVVEVLSDTDGKPAEKALVGALKDSHTEVLKFAIREVGEKGLWAAVPDLVDLLIHEEHSISLAAEGALQMIGNKSLTRLISTLRHRDPKRRAAAAKALGGFCYRRVEKPLVRALNDKNEDVVRHALSSLNHLFDDGSSLDPAAWKAWRTGPGKKAIMCDINRNRGRCNIVNCDD